MQFPRMQVTLDISHSTIEESEQRMEITTEATIDTLSEAASALGENALNMFGSSSMEPGVASLMLGSEGDAEESWPAGTKGGKGKGKKGQGKGKDGKGKGSGRKKEPLQCLVFDRRPSEFFHHVFFLCMAAESYRGSPRILARLDPWFCRCSSRTCKRARCGRFSCRP